MDICEKGDLNDIEGIFNEIHVLNGRFVTLLSHRIVTLLILPDPFHGSEVHPYIKLVFSHRANGKTCIPYVCENWWNLTLDKTGL